MKETLQPKFKLRETIRGIRQILKLNVKPDSIQKIEGQGMTGADTSVYHVQTLFKDNPYNVKTLFRE